MPVYDDEKTEAQRLSEITGIGSDEEAAMDREAHNGAAEDMGQHEGLYNPNGERSNGKSVSAGGLATAEAATGSSSGGGSDDTLGAGFTDKSSTGGSGLRGFFKGGKGRRRVIIGAGVAGLGVGSVMTLFSIVSGPMEFVHIAQLLRETHFSNQEDAGDGRFGKLVRWMRTGSQGETRLSFLESKYKNHIIADMEKSGFKPTFDSTTGYFKSVEIDTTSDKSPYKGMSDADVKAAMDNDFGTRSSTIEKIGEGKFRVTSNKFWGQRKALRGITKAMGYNAITTAERTRVLQKFGLVTFHPMKLLDKKANTKINDLYEKWKASHDERMKNGVKGTSIDTTKSTTLDDEGNSTPIDGESSTPDSGKIKSTLNDLAGSKSLKITGGVAAAYALVCGVKAINDNIGQINYEQAVKPRIALGMDAITVGEQVAYGSDTFDPLELDFRSRSFTDVNKDGTVSSSWDHAASIQANTGGSGGTDMDENSKRVLAGEKPEALAWTEKIPASICGTAASIAAGGISVAIGIVTGGTVSTLVGAVAGAVAVPKVMDFVSNLLAGDAADVAARGVGYGLNIDYGAALAANTAGLAVGGTELSPTELAQLNMESNEINNEEFSSKSLYARLLDTSDYRSVASQVIDSQANKSVSQTVASIVGSLTSLPKMIGSSINSTIFGAKVKAATSGYKYPFAILGFSKADLDNRLVDNPYDNAEYVATHLLDKIGQENGPPDYIKKAQQCFGVTISKTVASDGKEVWGAVPQADVNIYDKDAYNTASCRDAGNNDWLRVRFFIYDTATMEAYACYNGDDESCANSGFDTTSTSSDTGGATGTDSTAACAAGTDQGIQDGYDDGKKIAVRICLVEGTKVNTRVAKNFESMITTANTAGIKLSGGSGFRTAQEQHAARVANGCPNDTSPSSSCSVPTAPVGYSNHQMGLAVDFQCNNQSSFSFAGTSCFSWMKEHAKAYGFINLPSEAWHWSIDGR